MPARELQTTYHEIDEEDTMRTTISVSTLTLGLWLSWATPSLASDPFGGFGGFTGGVRVATGDISLREAIQPVNVVMADDDVLIGGTVRFRRGETLTIRFGEIGGKLAGDVFQTGRLAHDAVPFALEGACSRIGDGAGTPSGGSGNDVLLGDRGNDETTGGAGSDVLTGGLGGDVLSEWDGARATFRATGKESGEIRAAHPDDSGCVLVGRIEP